MLYRQHDFWAIFLLGAACLALTLPAVRALPFDALDLAALKSMWESTNGPNWNYESMGNCLVSYGYPMLRGERWNFTGSDVNPCRFAGVQCTCSIAVDMCHLLQLVVPCAEMGGRLPADWGTSGMAQCDLIDMDTNKLTGTIPKTLARISRLLYMDLDTNALTGTIPAELSALRQLQYLDLSYNQLAGTLPHTLSELSSVQILKVSMNKLSGVVPSSYRRLVNLTTFSLRGNSFYGDIFGFIDPAVQTQLSTLDISENAFNGNLHPGIFNLPALQTFIAGSNCFSGFMPENICSARLLETLVLTGLSSGVSCRDNIWSGTVFSGIFDGFAAKTFMQGSIPQCVYELQELVIFSASGNGLHGSAPDRISRSIASLDISRNKITGSITAALAAYLISAAANLTILDLSYNRIGGTLQAFENKDSNAYVAEAELTLMLKVNRLSGTVPVSLLPIQNISILAGNLFDCNADKSDIPQFDFDLATYQCGSTKMNNMLYVFTVFMATILLVLWATYREHGFARFSYTFLHWLSVLQEAQDIDESSKTTHIKRYGEYLREVRRFVLMIGGVLVVVSVGYLTLSAHFEQDVRTVSRAYTWGVTSAYLTGPYSTGYFFAVGVFIVSIVWYSILMDMRRAQLKAGSGARSLDRRAGAEVRQSISHNHNARIELPDMPICEALFKGYTVPAVRVLVMISIIWGTMLAGNLIYLEVQLKGTTAQQNNLNICFSIVKLFWTMVFTPWLCGVELLYFGVPEDVHTEFCRKVFGGIIPMLFVFNTVSSFVIPLLTVCAVDPACFRSMFFMSSSKVVSYPVVECAVNDPNGDCALYSKYTETISMDVPYTYNYTCVSSIMRIYTPLYQQMYMLLIVRSVFNFCYLAWDVSQEAAACRQKEQLETGPYSTSRFLLLLVLPTRYLIYSNCPRRAFYKPGRIFPRYNKLWVQKSVVNLLSHVLLILTFGVLVPPLALMILVAVVVETFVEQLVMGRFLVCELSVAHQSALLQSIANKKNYTGKLFFSQEHLAIREQAVQDAHEAWGAFAVLREVETQCMQIPASALALGRAAFFITPACMYAFAITDVQNSSDSGSEVLWPTLFMLLFPFVIEGSRLLYKFFIRHQSMKRRGVAEKARAGAALGQLELQEQEQEQEQEHVNPIAAAGHVKPRASEAQLRGSDSHDVL